MGEDKAETEVKHDNAKMGRCTYCGKSRPMSELEQVRICVNRGNQMLWFCRGEPCSGYYQMGCEG